MKKLPNDKRNQLILVLVAIGIVLSGLWFGLINYQRQYNARLTLQKQEAERKRERMRWALEHAGQIENELAEAANKLAKFENSMATGTDLNSWFYNTIRQFKLPYKVDMPQFSQVDGPKDVSLLPSFPYKQASITVGGTAFFHEFGRYISDFENQFPYTRILNLTLEPSAGAAGTDKEKLSFKMDVVVLVKPGAS